MATIQLTRTHRLLVGIVLAGAVLIAAIGFVGSYAAVRDLAEEKGFGSFAPFFPIGIDAGIVVLLALDLLLTWLRIPFPLLRQTAWLLTAATVAFNGAAAWGDPLAVGMHGIIPVLFIITVEAARHAIGRITDIAADRHMEGVRLWRWILAPIPTFRLWRRMKLWELRSYQEVIDLERDRLVYRTKLRATYGRRWRRRAPVEARLPLKLAHLGVPLDPQHTTRPTPTTTLQRTGERPVSTATASAAAPAVTAGRSGRSRGSRHTPTGPDADSPAHLDGDHERDLDAVTESGGRATAPPASSRPGQGHGEARTDEHAPESAPSETATGGTAPAAPTAPEPSHTLADGGELEPDAPFTPPPHSDVTVPVSPGRRRHLTHPTTANGTGTTPTPAAPGEPAPPDDEPVGLPKDFTPQQAFYDAYRAWIGREGDFPHARQLSRFLYEAHGIQNADGSLLSETYLRPYVREFKERYRTEAGV